jgi:hypothetical protein
MNKPSSVSMLIASTLLLILNISELNPEHPGQNSYWMTGTLMAITIFSAVAVFRIYCQQNKRK